MIQASSKLSLQDFGIPSYRRLKFCCLTQNTPNAKRKYRIYLSVSLNSLFSHWKTAIMSHWITSLPHLSLGFLNNYFMTWFPDPSPFSLPFIWCSLIYHDYDTASRIRHDSNKIWLLQSGTDCVSRPFTKISETMTAPQVFTQLLRENTTFSLRLEMFRRDLAFFPALPDCWKMKMKTTIAPTKLDFCSCF